MTPLKAIRAKCLDCMCGQAKEVRICPSADCALYPFRLGKNPYVRRELDDAEREEMAARLALAREAKKR